MSYHLQSVVSPGLDLGFALHFLTTIEQVIAETDCHSSPRLVLQQCPSMAEQ